MGTTYNTFTNGLINDDFPAAGWFNGCYDEVQNKVKDADDTFASASTGVGFVTAATYTFTPNTDFVILHYVCEQRAQGTDGTTIRASTGTTDQDQFQKPAPTSTDYENNLVGFFVLVAGTDYTKGSSTTFTLKFRSDGNQTVYYQRSYILS